MGDCRWTGLVKTNGADVADDDDADDDDDDGVPFPETPVYWSSPRAPLVLPGMGHGFCTCAAAVANAGIET